jgi:hypothetical protein
MEAVIFIGLQASGKSSFDKERFFSTHVRVSLDLLKTRPREERFLAVCLETDQRFVIDNTNPTREDRARYIPRAKAAGTPKKVEQHYGNAIYLKPYYGEPRDEELLHLASYLKSISSLDNYRRLEKRGWRFKAMQKEE